MNYPINIEFVEHICYNHIISIVWRIMKQGMLWYDNLTSRNLNERIEQAVNYFIQKYGEKPEQCFVHPEMIVHANDQVLLVKVVADEKVLHNHIWLEFPHVE